MNYSPQRRTPIAGDAEHAPDPAKPGTPPPVAPSRPDFAELSWHAEVAGWMLHRDVVYGLELEVRAQSQRRGIGGALLNHALREAHAAGARAAVLAPTPDTIAFYRLFGFELRPCLRERSFYLTPH